MQESQATILYGTEEPVAPSLPMRAGPLRMRLQGATLRDLRVGDTEVWHALAFVFRDKDWGTPEPVIETVEPAVRGDGFTLSIRGYFPAVEAQVPFRIDVEGGADGTLQFEAQAAPDGDVQTNRFGICLLHPSAAGGAPVVVRHADGRDSHSTIPTEVPAWPPFTLIAGLRHEWAPGCWADCTFSGDVFEFEDQRNNSDASFKTYNRSNMAPRPYWLRAGVAVRQGAVLRVDAPVSPFEAMPPGPVRVAAVNAWRPLPRIGTEIGPDNAGAEALGLGLTHLHLALAAGASVHWDGIAQTLHRTATRLRLDVTGLNVGTAAAVLRSMRDAMAPVLSLLDGAAVFPSEPGCIDAARDAFPGVPIGGGTEHFFVQLHRAERLGPADFATFTTCPTVHGTTEAEVMLTLQTLPTLVQALRGRYPQPIRIGPSTIGARRSPLGGQPDTDGTRRVALAKIDPRCRGLFAAAWVLGYIAQCARAGVDAVTLLRLSGPAGLVGAAGERRPAWYVLSRIGAFDDMRDLHVSDPVRVMGLVLRRGTLTEVLLCNLGAEPVDVTLDALGAPGMAAVLSAGSWAAFGAEATPWESLRHAAGGTVRLGAYAVLSYTPGAQGDAA